MHGREKVDDQARPKISRKSSDMYFSWPVATGMPGSSWAMVRGRKREVRNPRPTQELLLVYLWLLFEEHVMGRKESEDHEGSMMSLKLKLGNVRSDC